MYIVRSTYHDIAYTIYSTWLPRIRTSMGLDFKKGVPTILIIVHHFPVFSLYNLMVSHGFPIQMAMGALIDPPFLQESLVPTAPR